MTPKPQDDAPSDARPVYRIAVFGLGTRFQRLLEIIVKHARHNDYRYQVAEQRGPGEFDIALVDMTAKGGNEVARTLRSVPQALPVIAVGRRSNHRRGSDDLLFQTFSLDVLGVLNRAAGAVSLRERTRRMSSRLVQPEPGLRLPLIAGRAPRALVVDPSPSIRSQVAVALRQIGVDAEGVGTLAQAEDVLSMRSYELVILEPQQPDGDGIDMVNRFRNESTLSVPIIVLSSRSSLKDLARAAWAGCSGYLGKPVALSMLHGTVSRVLMRSMKARLEAERRAGVAAADGPMTVTIRGGPVTQLRRAMREGQPSEGTPALTAPADALVDDASALPEENGPVTEASAVPSIESALDAMTSRTARTAGPVRALRDLFRP